SDTSPAPPASSSSSATLPPEQCLTPPSVRRREARLARCAIAASNSGRGGAETETAGDDGTRERRPRTEYAAEEVQARRVGRRQAEREGWRGWEVEAEGYDGQRWDEGVVRADGTVDWARLEGATVGGEAAGLEHDVLALPTADDPLFLRDSLDYDAQPATLPSPPSTTTRLGLDSLPPNTVPLLLSALYIAFRALYPASRTYRRTRSAGQTGVEGKVRMGSRE
ncbi:ATP-dependent DNA helicase, partial [Rhodotorula toruloides]